MKGSFVSNLGSWQKLIELASKAGGPTKLLVKTVMGGAALGATAVVGVQQINKQIVEKRSADGESPRYTILKDLVLPEGRCLKKGDAFRLLFQDGNTAIIKLPGEHKPYSINFSVLVDASDVPPNDEKRPSQEEQP